MQTREKKNRGQGSGEAVCLCVYLGVKYVVHSRGPEIALSLFIWFLSVSLR